jgi:hypothetical protein
MKPRSINLVSYLNCGSGGDGDGDGSSSSNSSSSSSVWREMKEENIGYDDLKPVII